MGPGPVCESALILWMSLGDDLVAAIRTSTCFFRESHGFTHTLSKICCDSFLGNSKNLFNAYSPDKIKPI